MNRQLRNRKLFRHQNELLKDIASIDESIDELKKDKPANWLQEVELLEKDKVQLNQNIENIKLQIERNEYDADQFSYLFICDRMLQTAFEFFFKYYIYNHVAMKAAIMQFDEKGVEFLNTCSPSMQKMIANFNTKKYKEGNSEIHTDYDIYYSWVNPKKNRSHLQVSLAERNPFSFDNCLEYRGNGNSERIRNIIFDMENWDLDTLIERYERFRNNAAFEEKKMVENREKGAPGSMPSTFANL